MIRALLISAIFAISLTGMTSSPFAQTVSETSASISESDIESRAKEVGRALRCVVCQNQSIEESDASLAEDMRILVRARIREGDSNKDVMDYMQSRYGDFVLLEPPVQKNTYILWAFPFLLLVLGLLWFVRAARKQT